MIRSASCHGTYSGLLRSSDPFRGYRLYKGIERVRENGPLWLLDFAWRRTGFVGERGEGLTPSGSPRVRLDLQPGELVQVKSEKEIRATFTRPGKTGGLRFMAEMWKFCGRRFRVYKRLNRIMLESTEELRTIKDTVLLENNFCDGSMHYGCDRSCFHYWKESWLERVDPGGA